VGVSTADKWADALRDDDDAPIEHGGKVNLGLGSRFEPAMSDAE
jgi:hypothetical protein